MPKEEFDLEQKGERKKKIEERGRWRRGGGEFTIEGGYRDRTGKVHKTPGNWFTIKDLNCYGGGGC